MSDCNFTKNLVSIDGASSAVSTQQRNSSYCVHRAALSFIGTLSADRSLLSDGNKEAREMGL